MIGANCIGVWLELNALRRLTFTNLQPVRRRVIFISKLTIHKVAGIMLCIRGYTRWFQELDSLFLIRIDL